MIRPVMLAICAALMLAGCGGGDSSLNPMRWFGGGPKGPKTLEPKGGYARDDTRPPVAQILSARWEPLVEGRLLVVTALAPTQGWWDAALLTETPQPEGRVRPGPDSVLRLRLVAAPPLSDSPEARRAARPGPDTLTAAMAISHSALRSIDSVVITGAANSITLRN
ncbi:MAG TPA: hypothetical protein PLL33_01045 [Paracoccus sp. (in: a-proteobacteria)]|nr:hypothetical protein [Paracoccus sp. (in: a-proteobacteria)]